MALTVVGMALHDKGKNVAPVVVSSNDEADIVLDRFRGHLRGAIADSREKHEWVAFCIGVRPDYLSKMLSADRALQKPITLRHLVMLPDSVKAPLVRRVAHALGLLVITKAAGDMAVESLLTGLMGLVGGRRHRS